MNLKLCNGIMPLDKPRIMGIINVTPDSFYDGSDNLTKDTLLKKIEEFIADGADIIDIGAESTRPGSESISVEEEIQRLSLIIPFYKKYFDVPLSLDTMKSKVAQYGLDYGVDIINDVSGCDYDQDMMSVISRYSCSIIIMHMLGIPKTMQNQIDYHNVVDDICEFFSLKLKQLSQFSVSNVVLDPGIGFGKLLQHNLEIIRSLETFKCFDKPLLVGASRKSFIGEITGDLVDSRLEGSIVSSILAFVNGANILRVHDVKSIKKSLDVAMAIGGYNA